MTNFVAFECKLCHHTWLPRKPQTPRWCPKCGSQHWQTGRRRPPLAEQIERARAEGRGKGQDKDTA